MKKLMSQIIKFGFVGVLCFVIDYSIMILLVERFRVDYLVASGVSFTLSVIVNYQLSLLFVFKVDSKAMSKKDTLFFFILSIGGLLLNQVVMWLLVDLVSIYYMISKVIATAIVMVYNFVTRKWLLEKGK